MTRLVMVALAVSVWALGPAGTAAASPSFDVDGYSTCTATTVPGAGESFDGVVTACCVQHAGVPANTRYGMGCVAAVDNPSADYRPTIVLPSRAAPPDENEDAVNGLIEMPVPLPIDPQP